ncbi:MAG: hypothetical protein JST00_14070 [Deltaproteobacteria bacterium]|nr:hypothetical protein [Deltaproteobacteria bacterium]
MPRTGRALVVLACIVAPAVSLALSACGDDDAEPTPSDDAAVDGGPRRDAPELETSSDAEAGTRPPPTIPSCIGESRPMIKSGERTYAKVQMAKEAGAIAGDFLLDFGANGSTIDLGAFDTKPAPTFCNGDAGAPGARCNFPDFDFFGPWGTVELVTADYSFLFNSVRQAGIIGTDFLAVYSFTLDYVNEKIWRSTKASFCTDAQLLAAGYAPIPTSGFYVNDTSKLRPLSEVITDPDASTANFTVPNVPTVPITIAGAAGLAQFDTGYDDRLYRHSININKPMLDKILATSPNAIERRPARDLYLTTCVPGLSQLGEAYLVVSGTEVNFLAEGGGIGRKDTASILFVKERLPAAERCGGIETWTVPAAQLGASFVVDAQAAMFDPFASRVWLPRQ